MDGASFADHPKTVGEHRADKSGDATEWTPRDVLVRMLREIDQGTARPEMLVISWREGNRQRFWASSPDAVQTVGMLTCNIHDMLSPR